MVSQKFSPASTLRRSRELLRNPGMSLGKRPETFPKQFTRTPKKKKTGLFSVEVGIKRSDIKKDD